MEKLNEHLIVIGGTAAGMSAASRARKMAPALPITVFERTGFVTYGSCGLPYFVGGDINDHNELVTFTPDYLQNNRTIKVKTGCEVIHLDLEKKSVIVCNLETGDADEVFFSHLILATGASPVIPPIKGCDLLNVFTLRTIEDGIKIKEFSKNGIGKKAAIIGGGYIGLEMAEALRKNRLEVSVFEMFPRLLSQLDEEYADIVEAELLKHDVKVYKGTTISEIEGIGAYPKKVRTTDGKAFDADMVLISVGVRPNSELAAKAGLKIGINGGIVVDQFLQTSHPDVWACGDCVQMFDLILKQPTYAPLGTTANKQGKLAGDNVVGGKGVFAGVLGTQATKIFDTYVASTGLSEDKAIKTGLQPITVKIIKNDKASYWPGAKPMRIKLILENSGKLLGAQMIGSEGVAQRINVLVAAITAGMSVYELNELDMVYAPPLAPVYDPILIAASEGIKELAKY